jgi:hypothetical protein
MWDKGFDFRDQLGFVTDPTDGTGALALESYPVTRNGVTFGWDFGSISTADRNAGIDARLAGINYSTGIANFRVDLPAPGIYKVRLAMGDAGSSQTSATATIKDGSTPLLTIGPHALTVGQFWDGADVEWSSANWPGSNSVSAALTFSGSTLNLEMTTPALWTLAHLFVSQQVAAAVVADRPRGSQRPYPFAPGSARQRM